jgi:hypothetical protein
VFAKCIEPLDADDWIRTIVSNLEVAGVGENKKVLYATHYLTRQAREWWESVRAMQPERHVVTWEEFRTKFRKHHVPTGLIKIMREKFIHLK